MRNYRGMDHNDGYPLVELRLEDIERIFDLDFCQQILTVNFNGNLGDFSLARDAIQIVEYFLTNSPAAISISTNGSTRSPEWWTSLANERVRVGFDLDGLEDTHSIYRQNTDWHKIIANATAFIKSGGRAIWRMIRFLHNQHQIESCRQLAQNLGFEKFSLIDDGRDSGPVYTRDGRFSHWLGLPQKSIPSVSDLLQDHRVWFAKEKSFDWLADRKTITCEAQRSRSLYLAADGSIYPCCYLGFYPVTMRHPGNDQIRALVKDNNALIHGLDQSMKWFSTLAEKWQIDTIAQGRPMICVKTCGHR